MKKKLTLPITLVLLLLCGCGGELNSQMRFLLDTVVKVDADCDDRTLNGAFALCEELGALLSRTDEESDVYRINSTDGFVRVSPHTLRVVERGLYYGGLSGGKFDITMGSVTPLWDFKNGTVPSKDEISAALRSVDYGSVEIKGDEISAHGKKLDLGGIAKGYIADRLTEYFKENGTDDAVINLGGNVAVIGKKTVGIQKPFSDTVLLTAEIEDISAVTSGIYQRYTEKDGKLYHHVLDPDTGYGVENELASVTVFGESSTDCDALSTVCLLLGTEDGKKLIEEKTDAEAVFIGRGGEITLTSGLYREGDKIIFK